MFCIHCLDINYVYLTCRHVFSAKGAGSVLFTAVVLLPLEGVLCVLLLVIIELFDVYSLFA